MLEFENKTNLNYYTDLMKRYNLFDKTNIIIDPYYLHNRELIAIVDLLISFDSEYFIGCWISSFSQVIKNHHIYNNKKYILFQETNLV